MHPADVGGSIDMVGDEEDHSGGETVALVFLKLFEREAWASPI